MNIVEYYKNNLVAIRTIKDNKLLENIYITKFIEPAFLEIQSQNSKITFLLSIYNIASVESQIEMDKRNS
ncbi:hypothetical protein [Fusobacterium nucleatum]|uniref:Uncharacterized protein n=2 Tax=root TaxID=1 RepID=A0A133P0T5_FUSNU|nr:hypothetical protein [Fusobacterium nucleatum]KXA22134.1 hypothetical protein HMPREF3221_01014 [Fusobacterium nucleatum]DAF89199.1 MAG TPA: hypothetical protein [Podoviridae sp. ctP1X6]